MLRSLGLILTVASFASAAGRPPSDTLRWSQGAPNCTTHESEDGHVYYELAADNFHVTVAVDRQELTKVPHREMPMISIFASIQYNGSDTLEVSPTAFSLEFIKHRHTIQPALNPAVLAVNLEAEMQDVLDETERNMRKHPDSKQQSQTELQQRLVDYGQMIAFVRNHALRPVTLDSTKASASGWMFFSTKAPWIGALRRPELFMLRIPIQHWTVEFPLQMPPKSGKVELRRRRSKDQ